MRRRDLFTTLPLMASGALLLDRAGFTLARAQPLAPVRGGTLIATIEPLPSVLTTAFNNQYANALVSANIFDGLLRYGARMRPEGSLAERWELSPDSRSITFHLRQGVTWHDGVEFTSEDVKFSALEAWKKTHPRGRLTFAALTDVETPDKYTAIFRDVARLRGNPNLRFEIRGYDFHSQFYMLETNLRNPALAKRDVRRALDHAIDKQKLIDTVWYGLGKVATGPVPSHVDTFYTPDVPRYDFDPATAEKLLDAAGYPRKADGTRFALRLAFTAVGDVTANSAEFIRQNLKAVGVDVRLVNTDDPSYLRNVYKDYDFDLNLVQFSCLIDPQMGLFRVYWTKGQAPGVPYVNASGYSSPETDRLIDAISIEGDAQKRIGLFHDFQRQVMTDLPVLPLFEMQHFTFYNRRVHGLDTAPDGVISSLRDVWLES